MPRWPTSAPGFPSRASPREADLAPWDDFQVVRQRRTTFQAVWHRRTTFKSSGNVGRLESRPTALVAQVSFRTRIPRQILRNAAFRGVFPCRLIDHPHSDLRRELARWRCERRIPSGKGRRRAETGVCPAIKDTMTHGEGGGRALSPPRPGSPLVLSRLT